ncbi:hypothetical protein [Rodentibacter trehalosifermentans]|uniref:hypothetical protein n=1 Tax=Rodentibacter trehalosifermentans TaxID=1908263 RepID=UPI000985CA8D|nr:hypothetical protein [Rodentibacter trehalosifermentans]OOF48503.1 hypothetical protein BKK53_09620 [Rodentibacter trehalosifermentans]
MKVHYDVRIYFESNDDVDMWIWGERSILDDVKNHTSRWHKLHSLDEFLEPFEQKVPSKIEPVIPSYSKAYAQCQVQQRLAEIDDLMQWESEIIAGRVLDYCLDVIDIYYQKWDNRH